MVAMACLIEPLLLGSSLFLKHYKPVPASGPLHMLLLLPRMLLPLYTHFVGSYKSWLIYQGALPWVPWLKPPTDTIPTITTLICVLPGLYQKLKLPDPISLFVFWLIFVSSQNASSPRAGISLPAQQGCQHLTRCRAQGSTQ